jgi:hypothetical protein
MYGVMNSENLELWKRIQQFELDDEDSSLTFTDRLARENGWSHEFAIRAVLEYKKFIFLICISNQPLTPSDEVDQVWHLHLLYTHSYWDEFCGEILNRKIHHGPTRGGKRENDKFTNWYLQTLELYRNTFNEAPPVDIWPPDNIRFTSINFQRINTDRYWVIKKLFK